MATRIKRFLPKLINIRYIQDRYIGENIRRYLINLKHIPGLILLTDFEKAFDTIEWKFFYEALEAMGLGRDFIYWVKIL